MILKDKCVKIIYVNDKRVKRENINQEEKMEQTKTKVGILPNQFLKSDGTFDKDEAIKLSGKIAGVCYDK